MGILEVWTISDVTLSPEPLVSDIYLEGRSTQT